MKEKRTRKKQSAFYTRSFAVFSLFFTVLILGVSGIVLYVAPPGRYTNTVNWQVFSISKAGWEALHINFSLLFMIIVSLHVYFNWRVIRAYLRRGLSWTVRYRLELGAATAFSLLVFAGTLLNWPPFSSIVAFGEKMKRYWEINGISTIGSPWLVVSLIVAFLAAWGLFAVIKSPEKARG